MPRLRCSSTVYLRRRKLPDSNIWKIFVPSASGRRPSARRENGRAAQRRKKWWQTHKRRVNASSRQPKQKRTAVTVIVYRSKQKIRNTKETQKNTLPGLSQLQAELKREKYKRRYGVVLRSTVYALVVVAAVAVLVATLWLPVLQIYGASMAPTLSDGDILFSVKTADFEPGDIVAFYYNNKILVKRVIARTGDWVDMAEDGVVYVNERELQESYLTEKAFGETNIELPYQVPDGRLFVMGDHRSTSVDSRNTAVGCVAQEQIVGKIIFRVWPFERLGAVA